MQPALRRFAAFAACSLLLASAACGDDDEPKSESKDAGSDKDSSTGMTIPKGGRSGSGGGGTGGGSNAGYNCKPKAGDIGGPSESGAECCGALGTCTAAEGSNTGLPHATCKAQPDLRCLPKPVENEDAGQSLGFASCRVQLPGSPANAPNYEGRCMANCFVSSSPIASRLSQATCETGESCAPCYNPLNGRTTGICELPGDSPLEPPPPAFKECGDGSNGFCVPTYAAGNSAMQLSQLTCQVGEVCAPKNKVSDPGACFEHCDSGAGLGPGACAPNFLAGQLASLLSPSTCKTGELCIPCEFGVRTGVCD
jgi:hypothetical protein